jgi:hypothetical protein
MANLTNTQLNAIENRIKLQIINYLRSIEIKTSVIDTLREEAKEKFKAHIMSLPASEILDTTLDYYGKFQIKDKYLKLSNDEFNATLVANNISDFVFESRTFHLNTKDITLANALTNEMHDVLFKATMLNAPSAMSLVSDFESKIKTV